MRSPRISTSADDAAQLAPSIQPTATRLIPGNAPIPAAHDRAEVARRRGITRVRIPQLLDLTLLAPALQKELLDLEVVDGVEPICEAAIRSLPAAWPLGRTASTLRECFNRRVLRDTLPMHGPATPDLPPAVRLSRLAEVWSARPPASVHSTTYAVSSSWSVSYQVCAP